MKSKKSTGSYYTPNFLSTFIVKYVLEQISDYKSLSILEPSVGDGEFIRAFYNVDIPSNDVYFEAVEKIDIELNKAEESSEVLRNKVKFKFSACDFLEWQKNIEESYSLVVGNPPYIKKELLEKGQIEVCRNIHSSVLLPESSMKNIWTSFLIRCTQLLKDDGILAFVLPAELLQVKFTETIRQFLITQFARVEIFTFDELLFDSIGQDTIILVCYKESSNPGLYYTNIKDKSQLLDKSFILSSNEALVSTNSKWTHHILSSEEIDLLFKLKVNLELIDNYCTSKPGIVTAANDYFIVDKETEKRYGLADYTVPIIQKGQFVNGKVSFEKEDLIELMGSNKPSKFLRLNDEGFEFYHESLVDYLLEGEKRQLPSRHKCKKRKNWYVVPNVPPRASDALFFRRCHNYPKLLINGANALVTDSAYMVDIKDDYTINSLVFSFYNSLTLAFAELEGRYYAGGVLELTPKEFKGLPLPYTDVRKQEFETYSKRFKSKSSIDEVLADYNQHILHTSLKIEQETIDKIELIRKKLLNKRFRNN